MKIRCRSAYILPTSRIWEFLGILFHTLEQENSVPTLLKNAEAEDAPPFCCAL